MKSAYTVLTIIIIALAVATSIEADARASMFRQCVGNIKTNADKLTIDREDLELCIRAYDNRTSRSHELQRAIRRPVIESVAQSI